MSHISLPTKYSYESTEPYFGTVVVEPFFPGYGTTIGNALRRVLLSSLDGAAIRAFTVKGVQHEFSTLPGIEEDFVDIMLNLKSVAVRVNDSVALEAVSMHLSAKGKGKVYAKDFETPTGVEVMNPDQVIVTLTDDTAKLELDAYIDRGYGSTPFTEKYEKILGMITVDAYYSPVKDVASVIENVRVGQMTNFERLKLSIRTNGTVTPEEAFDKALAMVREQFAQVDVLRNATHSGVDETKDEV